MNLRENPNNKEGNFLFLTMSILLIGSGFILRKLGFFSKIAVSQYLVILLPALIFLKLKDYPIRENLRLNKTSFKNLVLAFFVAIFSYPVAIFLNLITIGFIERYGSLTPNIIPPAKNMKELFISILFIAITPGICEEIFFRGFLLSSYKNLDKKVAIILSGVLFGVFHYDLKNLLGPTFFGIVFGIMVVKSNSIYLSMLAHFTNNLIATMLLFFANKISEIPLNTPEIVESSIVGKNLILSLVPIVLSCLVVIYILLNQIDRGDNTDSSRPLRINEDKVIYIKEVDRVSFLGLLPILIALVIYIYFNYTVYFS